MVAPSARIPWQKHPYRIPSTNNTGTNIFIEEWNGSCLFFNRTWVMKQMMVLYFPTSDLAREITLCST